MSYSAFDFFKIYPSATKTIQRIGEALRKHGTEGYLVGGAVRDGLLGIASSDLDIMVLEDAIAFVRFLSQEWETWFPGVCQPGKPVLFKKYGTAKFPFPSILLDEADVVDFATARSETYPIPGQAPVVSGGDLYSDLRRRDFSVNALAVSITPESFGQIIDCCEGRADLAAGRLAVLHEKSFRDDPARLLRAVRFAARFSFVMEADTAAWFEQAVRGAYLKTLPPFRLFDELRKALSDPSADLIVSLLAQKGLLGQIYPGFALTDLFLD